MRHAANSAAALREPAARLDMIRCGIAIYGMDPFHRDPAEHGLEPALELVSYVAEVKRARAGESAGYGRRFIAERDTWIATIPIGYGDGVRRGLTGRAEVLVGGRRVPLAGTVSMDNITVDLGDEPVERGTEAVLLGTRGDERILAEDWASRAGHDQLRGDVRPQPRGCRERYEREALRHRARGAGRRGGAGWSAAPCATSCSGATPTTSTSRSPATRSGTRSGSRARPAGRRSSSAARSARGGSSGRSTPGTSTS